LRDKLLKKGITMRSLATCFSVVQSVLIELIVGFAVAIGQLVLYSIREGAPVSDITERALQKNLIEGLTGQPDYYREYIDVVRFSDPQYQSALHDFLRRKYEHQTFDLIITVAGRALDFVEQHGAELFPGVPVVFLGGGSSKVEELRTRLNCTGIFERVNLRATMDLALELQPGTSQVFVVSGVSEFDRAYEKELRYQARGLEGRVTFNYLSGLSLEEMQKRLAGLPRLIHHARRWFGSRAALSLWARTNTTRRKPPHISPLWTASGWINAR
jgi:hypothetical protein